MIQRLGEIIWGPIKSIISESSLKAEDFLLVRIGKLAYQALVEHISQLYQTLSSRCFFLSYKRPPTVIQQPSTPPKFTPDLDPVSEGEEPEGFYDENETNWPVAPCSSPVSFLEPPSSEAVLSALETSISNKYFPSFFCSDPEKINEKQIKKDCLERSFPLFINGALLWSPQTLLETLLAPNFPYEMTHQGFFASICSFMSEVFMKEFPSASLYTMEPCRKSSPSMPKEIKGTYAEAIALWFLRIPKEKAPFYLKLLMEAFSRKGGDPSLFFNPEKSLQAIQGEKTPCNACQGCLESEKTQPVLQKCKNPLQSLEEEKKSPYFSLTGLFSYFPFHSFLSYFWQKETPCCSFSLEDLTDILTILTALKKFLPEEVSSYFKEPTEADISYFPSKWIQITWEEEKKEAKVFGYFPIGSPEEAPIFIGYSALLNPETRQAEKLSFFADFANRF